MSNDIQKTAIQQALSFLAVDGVLYPTRDLPAVNSYNIVEVVVGEVNKKPVAIFCTDKTWEEQAGVTND